jgi:hypothetical protein
MNFSIISNFPNFLKILKQKLYKIKINSVRFKKRLLHHSIQTKILVQKENVTKVFQLKQVFKLLIINSLNMLMHNNIITKSIKHKVLFMIHC